MLGLQASSLAFFRAAARISLPVASLPEFAQEDVLEPVALGQPVLQSLGRVRLPVLRT